MSHYKITPAQRQYLQRKYAREAASAPCCDCPGCDDCAGFVKGCECDIKQGMEDLKQILRERRENG